MLWSFFQLDNMDEKEQADRMAAAEALFMISTRGDKSGTLQKSPRKSRKKKSDTQIEDTTVKVKLENGAGVTVNDAGRGRGRGKRVVREGRADAGGGRGGAKGSSPRGRAAETGKSRSSTKGQKRQSVDDSSKDKLQGGNNNQFHEQQKRNSTGGGDTLFVSEHDGDPKRRSRPRTSKRRNKKTKSNSPSNNFDDNSQASDTKDDPYLAIGFTGAAISINESNNSRRASVDSSQNLQSQGLVSGFRQVSLSSRNLQSTATVYGLPSMNLTSFTSDLNLPSLPLELGSLQLSSQPTPNLSSLADLAEGILEDDCTSGRKNSEKFLPLKKRKLHNPSEAEVREPTPPMDTSSHSDSEGRSEPQSPPPSQAEPVRASFTVQAPPIITMQTLMEIKTALTADDDGDLPLHIAVVHENMRMVIKLINLMRIAGKGVDKFNKQQQTPLHLAVKLNFLDAVDILLKSNASVNTVDCTGSSCIHMAVQGRSLECLSMLLERCPHADLNVRNFDGLTPLHIAVDNGDLHQVESLLKYNADIDVTDGKSGRTALFRAAESNQKAMVELLLSKGANPDVPNYAGVTTAMAAQGRNLHGILKLLGLVSTDKFTEYETKPSVLALESKVTPVYLGFPPSDSVAFSNNRSIKPSSQEIMCLLEPKVNKETSETASNETKVFHNVFLVSQGRSRKNKSMSEPSSPEVKMDVTEDADCEGYGRSGLMSLPEGIFCHSEEDRGDKMFVRQGNMTTVRQGELFSSLKARFHVPAGSSKSAVPVTQNEKKSVMLQIVPQPKSSSVSSAVVNTLTPTTNMLSSNMLSKLSYMLSTPVVSTPPVTSQSSATPLTNLPASTTDTVTLTGMQARLFQMLLKMYNIDQSNETSTASSVNRLNPSPLSSTAAPKLTLPSSSSLPHPALSPSVTSLYQRQEALRHSSVQQIPKNFDKPVVSSHGKEPESVISSPGFTHTLPSQHKLAGAGEHRTDKTTFKDGDQERLEESPLNLSTTPNRQNNIDTDRTRSDTLSVSKADTSGTVHLTPANNVLHQNRLSPAHQGSFGKVISIEIHRIPDNDNETKVSTEGNGQIEMVLLPPTEKKDILASVSSGQPEAKSGITLPVARTVTVSSVSSISSARLSERKLSDEVRRATPDSHQASTIAPLKTTSIVRDFLSQQSTVGILNCPSLPAQRSTQSSALTVLDFAKEARNFAKKKQVITLTRHAANAVTMDKAAKPAGSPVSVMLPVVSSSPSFPHQGQVIDLSRNKVTEPNAQKPASSLLKAEPEQGNIIGFSGAILSVVPPKLEKLEKCVPKEGICKQILKKRGRKSLKSLQTCPLVAESSLGKINCETDKKLKKFLDAKKLENVSPVFPDGMHDERLNGADLEESLGAQSESGLSKGWHDETYKTVGIFSGNIQNVKVGKKLNMSPSAGTSNTSPPLSVQLSVTPSTVSSSLAGAPSGSCTPGLNTEAHASHSENIGVTFSKLFATMNTVGKPVTVKKGPDSSLQTKGNQGNDIASAKAVSAVNQGHLPKKSKKSKKPLEVVVTKSSNSLVIKKGQISHSDYDNSDNSEIGNLVTFKVEQKPVAELNSNQGQKRNAKSLLSINLLQTMKKKEESLGKRDNMQTILSSSDSPHKLNKRQRRKKSEPQQSGPLPKSAPASKPQSAEAVSTQTKTHASSSADILQAISGAYRAEVSSMEVDGDDDDDSDEQPALCIEETEECD